MQRGVLESTLASARTDNEAGERSEYNITYNAQRLLQIATTHFVRGAMDVWLSVAK